LSDYERGLNDTRHPLTINSGETRHFRKERQLPRLTSVEKKSKDLRWLKSFLRSEASLPLQVPFSTFGSETGGTDRRSPPDKSLSTSSHEKDIAPRKTGLLKLSPTLPGGGHLQQTQLVFHGLNLTGERDLVVRRDTLCRSENPAPHSAKIPTPQSFETEVTRSGSLSHGFLSDSYDKTQNWAASAGQAHSGEKKKEGLSILISPP